MREISEARTRADQIVEEIAAECLESRIFLGTVNARAVISKHIAAVLAADAKGAGPVAVKPLEWLDGDHAAQAKAYPLGLTYTLQNGPDGWFAAVTGAGISEYLPGDFPDRGPAKALCQADFEQRIRSAIVDPPAALGAGPVAADKGVTEAEARTFEPRKKRRMIGYRLTGGELSPRAEAIYEDEQATGDQLSRADELSQIAGMLEAGQGDDDGSQISPDFEPGMSVVAKVEACLHLLERRRDVIEATDAGSAPKGWVLVPIKPTREMIVAAAEAHYGKKRIARSNVDGIAMTVNDHDYNFTQAFRRFWKGALAAAPAAPGEAP